eukprot:2943738-Prymnesium_polylepis.2
MTASLPIAPRGVKPASRGEGAHGSATIPTPAPSCALAVAVLAALLLVGKTLDNEAIDERVEDVLEARLISFGRPGGGDVAAGGAAAVPSMRFCCA